MIESVKSEHPTPATRRARAQRVMGTLPPAAQRERFDLVDYRQPSPEALEVGKSLEGRAKRALGRKRAA